MQRHYKLKVTKLTIYGMLCNFWSFIFVHILFANSKINFTAWREIEGNFWNGNVGWLNHLLQKGLVNDQNSILKYPAVREGFFAFSFKIWFIPRLKSHWPLWFHDNISSFFIFSPKCIFYLQMFTNLGFRWWFVMVLILILMTAILPYIVDSGQVWYSFKNKI